MNNIKIILTYDGGNYLGWQKTRHGLSIEESLEKVLSQILQHEIILQAASRTDAGVHARHQVINFFTPKKLNFPKFIHSLNQLLPHDIRAIDVSQAADHFHPTLDAQGKIYSYNVCTSNFLSPFERDTYWHFPKNLSLEKMQIASKFLIGKKDFSAFANTRKPVHTSTLCEIKDIHIHAREKKFEFTIEGDHFLYKMVRNIIGTLVYIGCGKLEASDIENILRQKKRALAAVTAPAQGLFLEKVFY